MKTFEECCDDVAKKEGLKNWNVLELLYQNQEQMLPFRFIEKAAMIWRRDGIREAVKLARYRGDFNEPATAFYSENEILDKLIL